jgi:1-acyl-sn-glycerol-3-phosphate acyltransferase
MFGWALRTIWHIPVDRSSARKACVSLQKAVELVNDKNRSLIIFPEGTRSLDGKVGQFNRASFSLVKDVGIKIVPVHLSGADKVANKKSWYITPGEVKLTIGELVDKKTVAELDKEELCNLVREKVVCLSN